MWAHASVISLVAGCSFQHGSATAGDGGAGGDGVAPASPLVDRGLVARYFIDEAASGGAPTALVDRAAAPLAIPIIYSPALAYAKGVATNRALRWSAASDPGRASVKIAGTKLETAFAAATAWTYELVVDCRVQGPQSRLLSINDGVNGYGTAALLSGSSTDLRLYAGASYASWLGSIDFGRGRLVLHAVVDATAAANRATAYVDGSPIAIAGNNIGAGAGLVLGPNDYFTVGNVEGSGRSFEGDVYYVAVYNVALDPAEVAANTAALLAGDDDR